MGRWILEIIFRSKGANMKRKIIMVLATFLALGILGCGGSKTETSAGDSTKQSGSTTPQTTTTWQTVFQDSNDVTEMVDKTTVTFHLGSGQKAARYTISASGERLFYATLQGGPEGYTGFPIGPITESGSGEIPINADEGDYFLRIQSKGCTWSLTIVESKQ